MKKIKLFLIGSAVVATSHSVTAQNGLHFDRVNDYVQTTFGGVTGSADRTFEAWVYVDASAPAANLSITDYGTNAAGDRNTFVVKGDRGIMFLAGGTNGNLSSTSANLIPDNTWMHVAFVLNAGTGFLYVNGTQVGTGNLSGVTTPTGTTDLRIGQRVNGGSILFGGIIDDVRIWNVARTPAEIMANMNNDICGLIPGLVAYYKLDEGVAGGANTGVTSAVDEIAGANGTLTSFALSGATSNWVTGATLSAGNVMSSQTLNECAGFSITVGSNTYTTTGNYTDTLVGSSFAGCDSIVNINLTVAAAIDTSVTSNFLVMTANQAGATYQWLACDTNSAAILGETNQTYTGVGNGSYAVEITMGNCVDTSGCITVVGVGINEIKESSVSIYPNPASNSIQVSLGAKVNVLNYSLTSITGKVIQANTEKNIDAISIDISNEAKGIYFLKLNNTTYKVIKE
jgi:hypothetical protein